MNYPIIFKLLSFITLIMALAFGACTAVSAYYSENAVEAGAYEPWVTSIAIAVVASLVFYLPGRGASRKIFKKEAMCVVGLGWLLCSLIGACPYFMILNCGFSNAFFESASGFTSTGASVFGNVEEFPRSVLFWRALTQWIGGLGVVILFVAVLSSLGAGAKAIYSSESSLETSSLERGRLKSGIWRILRIYLALSALCAAAFLAAGLPAFDSVCTMMATVSTGGFSVKNASFAAYSNRAAEWVAILFMFIGGTSFAVLLAAVKRDFKSVARNTEFKAYAAIVAALSAAIFLSIFNYSTPSVSGAAGTFTDSVFQVVSILTSTGFTSADYQTWAPVTHVLILFMLISGACTGSTSGGLKIARIVGVSKISLNDIEKSFRPNVVRPVMMNGRALGDSHARDMLSFTVLYALVSVAAMIILAAFEREMSLSGCISAVMACISNIGPGFNEVGPTKNFGFLSDASKIMLSILMVMGRLELYAILALFMPSLWKRFT